VTTFYKYSKPSCSTNASDFSYQLQGAAPAFSIQGQRLNVDTNNKQLSGQTYNFQVVARHLTKNYTVMKNVRVTIISKPPPPPIPDCPLYQRRVSSAGSHYILMLDSSGSMSRAGRWTELISEV
jgi:hypothetical protein